MTRNALSHLYDAAYLKNHPLAIALDVSAQLDRVTRAQRLRRLLLDSIETLRPQPHDGGVPEVARAYAILIYRYVDGLTMEDIAAKRALSERQAYGSSSVDSKRYGPRPRARWRSRPRRGARAYARNRVRR